MRFARCASSGSIRWSVTLVNRLEAALGLKISTVTLIQGPSIEQLVDEILPGLTGADDESRPQPIMLQPEAVHNGAADRAGRSRLVVESERPSGGWPTARTR